MSDQPVVLVHGFATSAARTWGDNGWIDLLRRRRASRSSPSTCSGHGTAGKPHDPAAYAEVESLVAAQLPDGPCRRDRVLDGRSRAAHHRSRPAGRASNTRGRRCRRQPVPRRPSQRHREGDRGSGRGRQSCGAVLRRAGTPARQRSQKRSSRACSRRGRTLDDGRLAKVTCPVLVVLGDRDFAGPADPLVDALPDAKLVTLAGRRPLRNAEGLPASSMPPSTSWGLRSEFAPIAGSSSASISMVCARTTRARSVRSSPASEGMDVGDLPDNRGWDFAEWRLGDLGGFDAVHRRAVLEHRMFRTMPVMPGAPEALWRLSDAGVWIRIITHRLYVNWGHADRGERHRRVARPQRHPLSRHLLPRAQARGRGGLLRRRQPRRRRGHCGTRATPSSCSTRRTTRTSRPAQGGDVDRGRTTRDDVRRRQRRRVAGDAARASTTASTASAAASAGGSIDATPGRSTTSCVVRRPGVVKARPARVRQSARTTSATSRSTGSSPGGPYHHE